MSSCDAISLFDSPRNGKFHHLSLPRRKRIEARSRLFNLCCVIRLQAFGLHSAPNDGGKVALGERLFNKVEWAESIAMISETPLRRRPPDATFNPH